MLRSMAMVEPSSSSTVETCRIGTPRVLRMLLPCPTPKLLSKLRLPRSALENEPVPTGALAALPPLFRFPNEPEAVSTFVVLGGGMVHHLRRSRRALPTGRVRERSRLSSRGHAPLPPECRRCSQWGVGRTEPCGRMLPRVPPIPRVVCGVSLVLDGRQLGLRSHFPAKDVVDWALRLRCRRRIRGGQQKARL